MFRCSAPAGACSALGEPFSWLSDIAVGIGSVAVLVGNDDEVGVDSGLVVVVRGRLLGSLGALESDRPANVGDGEDEGAGEAEAEEQEDVVQAAARKGRVARLALVLVMTCNHGGRQMFFNAVR